MATALYLEWGSDLVLTPNGGLQMAVGWDLVRQRILRKLLTNDQTVLPSGDAVPADYFFHTDYGLGLPRLVDQDLTRTFLGRMRQHILYAVLTDPDVAPTPPPTVSFRKPVPPHTLIVIVGVFLKSGEPGKIAIQM